MAFAQSVIGSSFGLVLFAIVALALIALLVAKTRRRNDASSIIDAKTFRAAAPVDLDPEDLPVEREDPDLIERKAVVRHIAQLMLADEWTEIGDQIAAWEAKLVSTPGGARYHDIGTEVALSGLQSLIDEAPRDTLNDLNEAEIELGYFIETYRRSTESHVLAILAARAHLALGEACRADHWPEETQREAWRRMARHFVEAGDILERYNALALMSPLVAEAQYLHALGSPGGSRRMCELFEAWIDLDPSNPSIYERHAERLSDPDLYDDNAILAEADRALERTEETLGFGGYALFFLPLLELREGARNLLDGDLFASAMLDLASMEATQAEINQTANALAAEVRATGGENTAMADTLFMLIRGHMSVIYPRLWTVPEDMIQSLVREAALAVPDLGLNLAPAMQDNTMSKAA